MRVACIYVSSTDRDVKAARWRMIVQTRSLDTVAIAILNGLFSVLRPGSYDGETFAPGGFDDPRVAEVLLVAVPLPLPLEHLVRRLLPAKPVATMELLSLLLERHPVETANNLPIDFLIRGLCTLVAPGPTGGSYTPTAARFAERLLIDLEAHNLVSLDAAQRLYRAASSALL